MEQITHPPHIKDKSNHISASAFIPFCLYQSKDITAGKLNSDQNLPFPICKSFKPTLLEGQLCYKLDLQQLSDQGKKNELLLLLDYNTELSLQPNSGSPDVDSFYLNSLDSEQYEAKIQIKSLSRMMNFGGGSYKMTDVKRMTAKTDFLKMALEDRNCEVEEYEDCRTKHLLQTCNCVPLGMPGYQASH